MSEEAGVHEKNREDVEILKELERLAYENGFSKTAFREFVRMNFGEVDTVDKLKEVKDYVEKNVDGVRRLCHLIENINKLANVDSGVLEILETVKPTVENLEKLDGEFRRYIESMGAEIVCDPLDFNLFIKSAEILAYEGLMECKDDELLLRVVDPANVAMVIARLRPDCISGSGVFGVSFSSINEYLKLAPRKGGCNVKIKDGVMTVEVTPEKEEDGPTRLRMRLISPDSVRKPPRLPEFEITAEMTVRNFSKVIKMIGFASDKAIFEVDEDRAVIIGEDDDNMVEIEVKEFRGEGRAMYSVDYLAEFAKVFQMCGDTVKVKFSTDHPAEFSCEGEKLSVKYIIAPKIEV
ncbi:MAG: hypothetical protein ACXQS2_04325 [Methermicoccaceae archaeon]